MEADLAQYYHLDIERMGTDYSHAHAACLAAQLPRGARCRVADNPKEEWSEETWMLWRIEHSTRLTRYQMGIAFQGEPSPPRQIDYPGAAHDRVAAEIRFRQTKQRVDEAFGIGE